MQELQKAFNVLEAAEYTGYTVNYIRKLVHQGKIPFFKPMGRKGRVFFKPSELQDFLFRNRTPAVYELQKAGK